MERWDAATTFDPTVGALRADPAGSHARAAGHTRRALTLDGVEFFLYAGDIHYARIARAQWRDSLTKMRQAGCNAILTYVPWNWHEPEEGQWDWSGRTRPERDLAGFLDLVADVGLDCVLRPGPFITGEWLNGGIPRWLLTAHPEILTLTADDRTLSPEIDFPPISYLHPVYESYVRRYYEALAPVVRPYLCTSGGPIIGVQLDDEPSYWQVMREGPTYLDYNPVMVGDAEGPGYFQSWLEERYGNIKALNRTYASHYTEFSEVDPPRSDPSHYLDLPRHLDWYYCKLIAIAEHASRLYQWVRELEFDVPLYMLIPYLSLQAATRFFAHTGKRGLDFVSGCECYFAIQSVAAMVEDHVGTIAGIHEIHKTWSLDIGSPPMNLETQASCGFHIAPGAVEALTVLQLGHGLNGISYYMFAGGDTPSGYTLQYGGSYDTGTPIGAKGELREVYPVLSRFGELLEGQGADLVTTETLQDMAIGFYEPYEAVSYIGNNLESGLRDEYSDVYENYFGVYYHTRRGPTLYSLLALSGINYGAVDVEAASLETLSKWSQLWVLGLDFMHRAVQTKLIEYVKQGGHLVLQPRVPFLDEVFSPSNILDELFPARPLRPRAGTKHGRLTPHHAIHAEGIEDMAVSDYLDTFELPPDAEALAVESQTREPCAYRRQVGRGSATLLGFKLHYWWDAKLDHKRFADLVFRRNGGQRVASAEGWELVVRERASDRSGFLFVVNPVALSRGARVTYRNPRSGAMETIPRLASSIDLPGQGGLILSLEREAGPYWLHYSTSQLQAIESDDASARLKLYGYRDTLGETALRMERPPHSVTFDSAPPHSEQFEDGVLTVTYWHGAEPGWLTVES